jgi:gluconolactonase
MKIALAAIALTSATLAVSGTLPPNSAVAPVKITELPSYTEGVVIDSAGGIYVSEPLRGGISLVKDGRVIDWAKLEAPNGHRILADGTHLVCDGKQHAVIRLGSDGRVLGKATSESDGQPLRAPNDLAVDPAGGFYFTDPGGSNLENPIGTVHYVDARGVTRTIATGLAFPNGIVLSRDGQMLFVGESKRNRILRYPVASPGRIGSQEVFATLPLKSGDQVANEPDGMALDDDGNLFVAHYGMRQVQVLNRAGRLERSYTAGNLTTSNVAFGGERMDQLFVTGALGAETTTPGALFRLDLPGVRGRTLLAAPGR